MSEILDHGYVNYVTSWGSDAAIIEAARMSTNKGFQGWGGNYVCSKCNEQFAPNTVIETNTDLRTHYGCGGTLTRIEGDEKLLKYLYTNKHMTPFEMAGMILEVKAPIMVFREWHRHRTQSYNEMSARYVPLPDENYMPTKQRIVEGVAKAGTNRQAVGALLTLDVNAVDGWLQMLEDVYKHAQVVYERGLDIGVPKEIARLSVPVARYSRMRVSANLRNWLQFLELRCAPNAQWEIRQYADAVAESLKSHFPRTMALFEEKT